MIRLDSDERLLIPLVISHNLHRRHLTESQRGMVASKLATMRQGRHPEKTPIGVFSKKDLATAAAQLQVGTTTVDRARRVEKQGASQGNQQKKEGSPIGGPSLLHTTYSRRN